VKLRAGVTVGLGVSLDTQNLNEAAHKVSRVLHDIPQRYVKLIPIRSAQASNLRNRKIRKGPRTCTSAGYRYFIADIDRASVPLLEVASIGATTLCALLLRYIGMEALYLLRQIAL